MLLFPFALKSVVTFLANYFFSSIIDPILKPVRRDGKSSYTYTNIILRCAFIAISPKLLYCFLIIIYHFSIFVEFPICQYSVLNFTTDL